jgi:hypothetical protein
MGYLGKFSPEAIADYGRWKRAQPRRRPRVRVRRPVFRFRLDRAVKGAALLAAVVGLSACSSIRDVNVVEPGRTAAVTVRWWGTWPPDLAPAIDSARVAAGIGCVDSIAFDGRAGMGWEYRITITGRP